MSMALSRAASRSNDNGRPDFRRRPAGSFIVVTIPAIASYATDRADPDIRSCSSAAARRGARAFFIISYQSIRNNATCASRLIFELRCDAQTPVFQRFCGLTLQRALQSVRALRCWNVLRVAASALLRTKQLGPQSARCGRSWRASRALRAASNGTVGYLSVIFPSRARPWLGQAAHGASVILNEVEKTLEMLPTCVPLEALSPFSRVSLSGSTPYPVSPFAYIHLSYSRFIEKYASVTEVRILISRISIAMRIVSSALRVRPEYGIRWEYRGEYGDICIYPVFPYSRFVRKYASVTELMISLRKSESVVNNSRSAPPPWPGRGQNRGERKFRANRP